MDASQPHRPVIRGSSVAPDGERSNERLVIAIVGAGAAGLTAAIFAGQAAAEMTAEPRPRVLLLDGATKIGSKILVAGGGRCNVTHDQVAPDDFHANRNIVRNILATFPAERTVEWFESLGVALKREPTGKLFPTTDNARTVLDALLQRCGALGVELLTDHRVTQIAATAKPGAERSEPTDSASSFTVIHAHGMLHADAVILATGGRSLPRTGSDGQGYRLARTLGHTVTDTHAALVPLKLDDRFFHADLAGVSHEATLSVLADGKRIDRRTGSMLWTHVGVSGPLVMDASRFYTIATDQGRSVDVRLSVLGDTDFQTADHAIADHARRSPRSPLHRLFSDRLAARLMPALLQHLGLNADQTLATLSKTDRRTLAHGLTDLPLPVTHHRGWNYAEVTAGGVPLSEIDRRTMQSRRTPGLYLVGEILDCDGRIGGFNFQWAWATGRLAGNAAAESIGDA